MNGPTLPELLAAWRDAERRWEQIAIGDVVKERAAAVLAAWVAYQNASLADDSEEFLLVADDDGVYRAAAGAVTRVLRYEAADLIGLRIEDITATEMQPDAARLWGQFLIDGRQDGRYRLRASDGRVVMVRFQARAHFPVPGFHLSRIWPDDEVAK